MSSCNHPATHQCPKCQQKASARWKNGELFCLRCLKKMKAIDGNTPQGICSECMAMAMQINNEYLDDSIKAAIMRAKGEV